MGRRKLEIKVDPGAIEELKHCLKRGATLNLALAKSGISSATYYYWVAMASIVKEIKNQEEVDEMEELAKSGIAVEQIKMAADEMQSSKKSSIGAYIEPTAQSLLKYRNSGVFRKFANQCYDIITECDKLRSEYCMLQLGIIAASTNIKDGKKINPYGAMWYLERSMPESFAKPSDKVKETENEKVGVESIKVEFINPADRDSMDRLKQMEAEIMSELKVNGQS